MYKPIRAAAVFLFVLGCSVLVRAQVAPAQAPAPASAAGDSDQSKIQNPKSKISSLPPPFKYVPATAFHVLPGTHNHESGLGSLCEGLDGTIYVGTAKIGANCYLVAFDPDTHEQRIVIDAQKICALDATGFAAQAVIATANFVAPSGRIYVGTDHGTPTHSDLDDHVVFPGGHVLTWDPRIGLATDLGVPLAGEGVSDVAADERRNLVYVVTSDHQHWLVGDPSSVYQQSERPVTPPTPDNTPATPANAVPAAPPTPAPAPAPGSGPGSGPTAPRRGGRVPRPRGAGPPGPPGAPGAPGAAGEPAAPPSAASPASPNAERASGPTPAGGGAGAAEVKYHDLGPTLAPGATTLIDSRGIASALALLTPPSSSKSRTDNQESPDTPHPFQLVQYDPAARANNAITVRDIMLPGQRFTRRTPQDIPLWALAPDGHTAYLTLADNPMLLSIDLADPSPIVVAHIHGQLLQGRNPQLHAGLTFSPDGKLYTLVRVDNETGYGIGPLHHLVRFDPGAGSSSATIEDLGVLVVSNPGFFDFVPAGTPGKPDHIPAWCQGFQGFPDGTIAPMLSHTALRAGHDGTLYATVNNPFTLLRIDTCKLPQEPNPTPTRQVVQAIIDACHRTDAEMDHFTQVAEVMAKRYINGGMIGFLPRNEPFIQCLDLELLGRGGGILHIGFDRPWKENRTAAEQANDTLIADWERPPGSKELVDIREFKKRGGYVIGFGSSAMPQIAQHIKLCDAFFDTGVPTDGVVHLPDGGSTGYVFPSIIAIRGWVLCAEFVAAVTRQGHMPTMWKSYSWKEGIAWGGRYFRKFQFHDDYVVPPQPPGLLGRAYLQRARSDLRSFLFTQQPAVRAAAETIVAEAAAKRKSLVAWSGHMPIAFVGHYDDVRWSTSKEFNYFIPTEAQDWPKNEPEGVLVVALGELGFQSEQIALHHHMKSRVIAILGQNAYPQYQGVYEADQSIYDFAPMGDACVPLEGYPIRIFPTSGFMAAAAYESLDAEVITRLHK